MILKYSFSDSSLAATVGNDAEIIRDLAFSHADVGHVLDSDEKAGVLTNIEPADGDEIAPTEEEKATLRRIPGYVNAAGFILCFIEGANNASYYGVTGVFTNFIQRPLPKGGNSAVSSLFHCSPA